MYMNIFFDDSNHTARMHKLNWIIAGMIVSCVLYNGTNRTADFRLACASVQSERMSFNHRNQ